MRFLGKHINSNGQLHQNFSEEANVRESPV